MNVGIDSDATITETPEIFALLSHALQKAGLRVYVVSYRDPADLEKSRAEVDGYGISFDDMPEAFTQMPSGVKRLWLCDPKVHDLKRMIDALGPGMLKFSGGRGY